MKDNYATINLLDWGVCFNGEHYTAEVWHNNDHFTADQVMTDGLAGRLNKKDTTRSNRPGDTTSRFETEESAIRASVDQARERWNIKCVFVNDCANPHYVPWCVDEKLQRKMNVLHERMELIYKISNDPWSVDAVTTDAIYATWEELINELVNMR